MVDIAQENATDALTQLYNRRFIHAEFGVRCIKNIWKIIHHFLFCY